MYKKLIAQAMSANLKVTRDYKNGSISAGRYLMGQVMKLSKGTANPAKVMKELGLK